MARLNNLKVGTIIKCKNTHYHPEIIENDQEYYTLRKGIEKTCVVIDEETDRRKMHTYWEIISDGNGKGWHVNPKDIPNDYELIAI